MFSLSLLLVLLLSVLATHAYNYPTYSVVADTHLEAGCSIGKQAKARIAAAVQADTKLPRLRSYVATAAGEAKFKALEQAHRAAFPGYFDEIVGMALCAEQSTEDLLLLNWSTELGGAHHELANEHCSDLAGNGVMGHNEDAENTTAVYAYFVNVSIRGAPTFLAWTYAGHLSGNAFGMNENRLAITTNAVFPTAFYNGTDGLARTFVNRGLLDAANFTDAIARAQHGPLVAGFAANVGVFGAVQQGNIEIGPGSTSSFVQTDSTTPAVFHFNAYLRLDAPQWYGPSSRARLARLQQLLPGQLPLTETGVTSILGDTAGGNGQYPIFRDGTPPDDVETMATVLFALHSDQAWLYAGNPKLGVRSPLPVPFGAVPSK